MAKQEKKLSERYKFYNDKIFSGFIIQTIGLILLGRVK